ncbi:MAG: SGNH/GDSL hydrolase family protein [Lachnospiraceae bacterium]|nr:SGNH/GDSL hydrolase family protein [Lachnospiraceae bacterium]
MLKKIAGVLAALCIAVLILAALQRLVTPKYYDGDMAEGGLIEAYYDTEKDHDVIFLGDCEVYENFDPAVIERETGLKTYIRGSAQQLIWQSYYLLEDTLRYETPKAVVFNVLSMKYNEPQNEAYNRLTLEGMEWSAAKIGAINASMTGDESFITYVFPILRYHDRLRDLTSEDFEYFFGSPQITTDGSYLREGVVPAKNIPLGKPLESYDFGDTAWEYMEKMRKLCEEKGIKLILIKAPASYPYWYDEWNGNIADYADSHGLSYINFLYRLKSTGLSFDTDTYDGGLHLNKTGAEKLSAYFAPILKDLVEDGESVTVDRLNGHIEKSGPVAQVPVFYFTALDETDTYVERPEQTVSNSSDGLGFTYKGLTLRPGMKWDETVSAQLGEPINYFEAKSCVFEGIDRMYTYPGIEVDVSPDGSGSECISSIYLTDDSVETPEGAYIGCPQSLIEKLYGTADEAEENRMVYFGNNCKLTFSLRDGAVVAIIYELL